MTAMYRRVDAGTWGDENFLALSDDAKLLWFWLLTGPEVTSLPGLIVTGRAALAEAMGWELDRFDLAMSELTRPKRDGLPMVKVDWRARVVWLPKAYLHNRPPNPNVVAGWGAHWQMVPESVLKEEARGALFSFVSQLGERFREAFRNHIGEGLSRARAPDSASVTASVPEGGSKGGPARPLQPLTPRARELAEGVMMTAGPFDVEAEWAKFQLNGKDQSERGWQTWSANAASFAKRHAGRRPIPIAPPPRRPELADWTDGPPAQKAAKA